MKPRVGNESIRYRVACAVGIKLSCPPEANWFFLFKRLRQSFSDGAAKRTHTVNQDFQAI